MLQLPHQRHRRSASPWHRSSIAPATNLLPVRSDPALRPSRRRLRRATQEWLPLGMSDVVAKITVLRHGGHERPIIGRGGKHLRFRFPSMKTGTTQLGEGRGEEFLAFYNEVATAVGDYESHPYKLEYMHDGKLRSYRPDAVRMFRDGQVELLECKRTPADLSDDDYRENLAVVAEIARVVGMEFRVLYLDDIYGPAPRRNNVWALFARRSMELTLDEERLARGLVGSGEPVEWGDLRERLAPTDLLRGDAVIEALLARGTIETDLDVKFAKDSVLQPTGPFMVASEIRI